MAYGTLKCDNIVFDNGGTDKLVTVSGLFFSTSGALTVTGTISGGNVTAPTATFTTLTGTTTTGTTATFTSGSFTSVTGTTVTGITANFASGVFTTRVSGTTVTGTTANFTSGNFTSLSGTTTTVTSGVFSAGSATAPSVAVGTGTSNAPGIYSPGTDQLAISTSGTEKLIVKSDGKVGIGTSSPGEKLSVVGGNISFDYGYSILSNGGFVQRKYLWSAYTTQDILNFGVPGTYGGYGADATTARMTITQGGNVGIGTMSPAAALDVNGNVLLTNSSYLGFGNADALIQGSSASSANFLMFRTNVQERARIDHAGRFLVGTSTAQGNNFLQVQTDNVDGGGAVFLRLAKDASAINAAGYFLGTLNFGNQQGGIGASVRAESDAAWGGTGSTDNPGRLVFSTCSDGSASPTERVRITSTGQVSIASGLAVIDTATSNAPYLALASSPTNATGAEVRMGARVSSSSTSAGIKAIHPDGSDPDFVSIGIYVRNSGTSTDPALEIARADYQGSFRPGADNVRPLGNASFRWSVVFAGTGTINTSDETLKEDIQDLEQAELSVAAEIKSLIKRFRFKDAVASKGDDARIHVGVIAQEVEQAFVDNGLDPRRYALFCEDTLEDGSKRLGIRYDELLAFVIAAL